MNKANWRDTAELVGILAIVVSLFLLTYELRQNTIASKQQAAATYAASSRDLDLFVSGNSEIAAIIFKSVSQQDLSPEENFRLHNFYRSVLRNWQDTHYQYLSESLDDNIWIAERRFISGIFRGDPGFRRFWQRSREIYTDDFQLLINQILQEIDSGSGARE